MSEASILPQGWLEVTLDDLGMPKTTNVDPSKFPDEHFELWSVPNFPNGPEFSYGKEIGSSKQSVEPGDVLLCKINPRINRVEIVGAATDYRQIASSEWIVIRSEYGDPTYVKHVLTAENFRKALLRDVSGVGGSLMRARPAAVRQLEVPIAPLKEQRRIVAKIESLESHREAAQEELEAIPPLLEKFRQSVLAAAFRGDLTREWRAQNPDVEPASVLLERIRTERKARFIEDAAETARAKAEAKARDAGKPWTDADDQDVLEKERGKAEKKYKEPEPVDATDLPELPEGWCWASVDEISSSLDQGWSPKCLSEPAPDDKTWGVIKTTAVQHLRFDAKHNKALPTSLAERPGLEIRPGDLLITRAGPRLRVGVCCHVRSVRPRLMICDKVYRLRTIQPCVRPEFIELALNTRRIVDLLERLKTGIDDSGVNLTQMKFRSLPIPLAPHDEQRAISESVESALAFSDEILERVSMTDSLRAQLGQSLLAKAFRGELVPQDPNDEPASVLLERIRAERAEADAQGKPKKKAARKTTKKATGKKNVAKASS